MTIAERKRARDLRDVMKAYAKFASVIPPVVILSAIIVIAGTLLMIGSIDEDELFMAVPFAAMTMPMVMITSTAWGGMVGDGVKPNRANNPAVNGALYTGKFLSTLPFYARDLQNLRVIQWEIASAASVIVVAAAQIFSMIAESLGYTMLHGTVGFAVLIVIIFDILSTMDCFIKKWSVQFIFGILCGVIWALMIDLIFNTADVHEDALATNDSLSVFRIFYGVPGILLHIGITVLIAVIMELYIKNKKTFSWHLN